MSAVEDLYDAGFDKLIIRQMLSCLQKQMLAEYFSIIKAISQKADLSTNVTNFLITNLSESLGNNSRLNLQINGSELLIFIGNYEAAIAVRAEEMKSEIATCDENKKVFLQNKLNRFQEWVQQFKEFTKIHADHVKATSTLQ